MLINLVQYKSESVLVSVTVHGQHLNIFLNNPFLLASVGQCEQSIRWQNPLGLGLRNWSSPGVGVKYCDESVSRCVQAD